MMKFRFLGLLLIAVFGVWLIKFQTSVLAVTESDCLNKDVSQLSPDDMNQCIETILPRIASAYAPAQQKNKEDLANLNKQFSDLSSRITKMGAQLKSLETEIAKREQDLAFTKTIFDEKAKD